MFYFAFEGIDGSGKTTVLDRVFEELVKNHLPDERWGVLKTKQPGDPMDYLRPILLDASKYSMCNKANELLFLADVAENVHKVLHFERDLGRPFADQREKLIVLSDRSKLSHYAYAHAKGELTPAWVTTCEYAFDGLKIDMTFVIGCRLITAAKRRMKSGKEIPSEHDRMESEGDIFQDKVDTFMHNAKTMPLLDVGEIDYVDNEGDTPDNAIDRVVAIISRRIGNRKTED